MRTTVYMGHPLSGNFDQNIANANLWYRFLRSLNAKGVKKLLGMVDKVVVTHEKLVNKRPSLNPDKDGHVWLTAADILRVETYESRSILVDPFEETPTIIAPWLTCPVPDKRYPGGRDKAMLDCRAIVSIVDEMWQVGGRISDGMADEGTHARLVRDLSCWGETPPMWDDTSLFGW